MLVIIGSKALEFHTSLDRVSKDLDIVGTLDDVQDFLNDFDKVYCYPINSGKKILAETTEGLIIEAEIAWENSTAESLLALVMEDPNSIYTEDSVIPSLDVLYMLKMSHRYLKDSPHFHKTMKDIHNMRKLGAVIRPEHEEFYNKRMEATYSYSHPSLKKNKNNFFANDNVNYVYDHDTLHLSVMVGDKPAYENFKSDTHDVWCDKNKFFACDEQIKLNAVLEESLVLALERSQVPYPETDRNDSFKKALEKVCSSITSGWFREYAWENYYKVLEMYEKSHTGYVEKFKNDVQSGLVKLNVRR